MSGIKNMMNAMVFSMVFALTICRIISKVSHVLLQLTFVFNLFDSFYTDKYKNSFSLYNFSKNYIVVSTTGMLQQQENFNLLLFFFWQV